MAQAFAPACSLVPTCQEYNLNGRLVVRPTKQHIQHGVITIIIDSNPMLVVSSELDGNDIKISLRRPHRASAEATLVDTRNNNDKPKLPLYTHLVGS